MAVTSSTLTSQLKEATSIWENYNIAAKAIKAESQGLIQIISLASTIPELKNSNLANTTRTYAKSVIDEEWQTLSSVSNDSPKTIEKFIAMRSDFFKAANQLNNNAESKILIHAFQTVDDARGMRLAYVSFDVHPLRMIGILLLAILVYNYIYQEHRNISTELPVTTILFGKKLDIYGLSVALSNVEFIETSNIYEFDFNIINPYDVSYYITPVEWEIQELIDEFINYVDVFSDSRDRNHISDSRDRKACFQFQPKFKEYS